MDYFENLSDSDKTARKARIKLLEEDIDTLEKTENKKELGFTIEHCSRLLSHWEWERNEYQTHNQEKTPRLIILKSKHIYTIETPFNTLDFNKDSINGVDKQSRIIPLEVNISSIKKEIEILENLRYAIILQNDNGDSATRISEEPVKAMRKLLAYWEYLVNKL